MRTRYRPKRKAERRRAARPKKPPARCRLITNCGVTAYGAERPPLALHPGPTPKGGRKRMTWEEYERAHPPKQRTAAGLIAAMASALFGAMKRGLSRKRETANESPAKPS